MSNQLEIEYKFLIEKPSLLWLRENSDRIIEMEQTYLIERKKGTNLRVRKCIEDGRVSYIETEKERINVLTCIEREREVSREEYETLLTLKREDSETISKTRYKIPYFGHILEIDLYTFFGNYATLEIELKSERENFEIPKELKVIADVTEIHAFKNTKLAKWIKSNPGMEFPALQIVKEKSK